MNRFTREKSRQMVACIMILFLLACSVAYAATSASEDEVRAAFLFQLAQYVNWPTDGTRPADKPLRFCVLGQDQLTAKLEPAVKGKRIQGRNISVQRIGTANSLGVCDLAFVGYRSEKQIRAALHSSHFPAVLLVGEADGFAEMGGMVNLVILSGRVSFEINVAAAERAHLEFRSQLLRFARLVTAAVEKGEKQ